MTTLDWIIVAFAVLLAGFRLPAGIHRGGALVRGFRAGRIRRNPPGSSAALARIRLAVCARVRAVGALLAGAILATGLEGLGFRLRRTLVVPGLGLLDGLLGALLGAALGLGIVWIVAAVAGQTPNDSQLRADIQRSVILGELNQLLPPSGPILNALSRLDPLPQVPGPTPDVAAPLPQIGRAAGRARGRAQRRARARHRLRAGDRGLRLGGASR